MMNPEESRPSRRGIRRGIYIVPSVFTIGNILCGFYAVINGVKGYQLLDRPAQAIPLFSNAAWAIGLAVLLDGLDGRIARMTGATSEFGVELDSIADVVTFGIAPAVLAYTWGYGSTPGLEGLAWGISFFFLICGALRLARFNVQARLPRFASPGVSPKLDKRYFVGLPIPMAAGVIAAIIHFSPFPVASHFQPVSGESGGSIDEGRLYSWGLVAVVALLAMLMVSTFRYTSFKDIGPRSNKPFITLPMLSLLVMGVALYSEWVLLILTTVYAAHGPALKVWNLLHRFRRPRREIEEQPPAAPAKL
jgi:CDP-diacylglycerol--serine O-phosphatidyltransferase